MYNVMGLIGGDSSLSPKGLEYARALPDFLIDRMPEVRGLCACVLHVCACVCWRVYALPDFLIDRMPEVRGVRGLCVYMWHILHVCTSARARCPTSSSAACQRCAACACACARARARVRVGVPKARGGRARV